MDGPYSPYLLGFWRGRYIHFPVKWMSLEQGTDEFMPNRLTVNPRLFLVGCWFFVWGSFAGTAQFLWPRSLLWMGCHCLPTVSRHSRSLTNEVIRYNHVSLYYFGRLSARMYIEYQMSRTVLCNPRATWCARRMISIGPTELP